MTLRLHDPAPHRVGVCPHCKAPVVRGGPLEDIETTALRLVANDISGASVGCWRFFEILFDRSGATRSVADVARALGMPQSTLASRFQRAKLPTIKAYVIHARLVRAARLFENPAWSIHRVAIELDESSSQALGRTVRIYTGMTGAKFRRKHDGESYLAAFRERYVLPYRDVLRDFHPLADVRQVGKVAA